MKIVFIIIYTLSVFTIGFLAGTNKAEYENAIATVKAVDKTLKQERVKQDEKDKELAEANKLISKLRATNERVQQSLYKPSRDLQTCERKCIRLQQLTKRCSSVITRYIEGTDKLLIERR